MSTGLTASPPPMRQCIPIEPLRADRFARYGTVLHSDDAFDRIVVNEGRAVRFDLPAHIDVDEAGGRPRLSIFRAEATPMPWRVASLERHPWGSQTFHPLSPQPYLVLVSLGAEAPSRAELRCFLASAGQGVHYARGTWHHSLLALRAQSDFLVIDRAAEPGRPNCDESSTLDWHLWIEPPLGGPMT